MLAQVLEMYNATYFINMLKNKTNMNLNGENYALEVRKLRHTMLKKAV